MTRDEFLQHRDGLKLLVDTTHKITAVIVLVSFVGYGLAAYIWFQGHVLGAAVVASLAYLMFRLFRPISLSFARLRLQDKPQYAEALALFEAELQDHKPQVVLSHIIALEAAEAAEPPP